MNVDLALSNTMFAFGPISMAIAPAPPVGLAGPLGYTAISADNTIPYLPIHNNIIHPFILTIIGL